MEDGPTGEEGNTTAGSEHSLEIAEIHRHLRFLLVSLKEP